MLSKSLSIAVIVDIYGEERKIGPPTSDIDFVQLVEQSRKKSNKVEQSQTSDIDFVRLEST